MRRGSKEERRRRRRRRHGSWHLRHGRPSVVSDAIWIFDSRRKSDESHAKCRQGRGRERGRRGPGEREAECKGASNTTGRGHTYSFRTRSPPRCSLTLPPTSPETPCIVLPLQIEHAISCAALLACLPACHLLLLTSCAAEALQFVCGMRGRRRVTCCNVRTVRALTHRMTVKRSVGKSDGSLIPNFQFSAKLCRW